MAKKIKTTITEEALVNVLLENLDDSDINSMINTNAKVQDFVRKIGEVKDMLNNMIKAYLKERQWNRYVDKDTKVSVSLSMQSRESVDMQQLKIMLTEPQLAQVIRTTTFEKMQIITPETRARLKQYAKTKKKG